MRAVIKRKSDQRMTTRKQLKKGSLLPRTVVKDCLPLKEGSGIAGKKVQNGGPRRSMLKQSYPGKPQCFIPLEADSGTSPVAAEMAQFQTGAGDKSGGGEKRNVAAHRLWSPKRCYRFPCRAERAEWLKKSEVGQSRHS